MEDDTAWYCIKCTKPIFPFNDTDNNKLHSTIHGKKIKLTKTNPNECNLTEHLNNMMNQKEFDNPSAYYDYKKFNENFHQNTYKGTNILHMNINSFSCHFDEFHTLLLQLSVKFDIISIAETHLKTHALRTSDILLQGYSIEHTPTESVCGGSLLHINTDINYICKNNLQIYKKKEIESTFIEIINPNGKYNSLYNISFQNYISL